MLYYDGFGRLEESTSPDGLVKSQTYANNALVDTMTLRNSGVSESHQFHFDYDDPLHRLTQISQVKADGTTRELQSFGYDDFGNASTLTDKTSSFTNETRRLFDNLGNLLTEESSLSGAGVRNYTNKVKYAINYVAGFREVQLPDLDNRSRPVLWNRARYQSDRAGRHQRLDLDRQPFATQANLGQQPVSTAIKEAGFTKTAQLSPWLEVTNLRVAAFQGIFAATFDSHLDNTGRVLATRFQTQDPAVERTTFFEHDAYGAVVGEGSVERFEPLPIQAWFTATTNSTSPTYWRMSHRDYDQVENLCRAYRKIGPGGPDSPEQTVNEVFYSSAPPQEDLRKLSSAALASAKSDQLRTIVSKAGIPEQLDYDYRGQLRGYRAYEGTNAYQWQLTYDPLGRLSKAQKEVAGEHTTVQTLEFAYDALNRRVLKKVVVHQHTKLQHFGNADGQLALVKANGGDPSEPWVVDSQYLWGATPGDLLMAVLSQDAVEHNGEADLKRYYFH